VKNRTAPVEVEVAALSTRRSVDACGGEVLLGGVDRAGGVDLGLLAGMVWLVMC
jgi:hypothetical protein